MKSGIGNPFTPIPKNRKSHVRGWAMHWADLLELPPTCIMSKGDSFSDIDVLYLEHGVNITPGNLNLFGGFNSEIAEALIEIILNSRLRIVSLDHPLPRMEYIENLRKRVNQKTASPLSTLALVDALAKSFSGATHLTQVDMFKGSVTIGDSHSAAYALSGSVVERRNGMTLHGALERGEFMEILKPYADMQIETVTLVAGSVDVRHHLLRQGSPRDAIEELVRRYVLAAEDISCEFLCEVELCVPVPIEHADRKIPQTGFYKDAPFYGSVDDRRKVNEIFEEHLRKLWPGKVVKPPSEFYEMDPEDYASEHMELGGSVHMAPHAYRRVWEW